MDWIAGKMEEFCASMGGRLTFESYKNGFVYFNFRNGDNKGNEWNLQKVINLNLITSRVGFRIYGKKGVLKKIKREFQLLKMNFSWGNLLMTIC